MKEGSISFQDKNGSKHKVRKKALKGTRINPRPEEL